MILRSLLALCTDPPIRPIRRVTLYYMLLAGTLATLLWIWPWLAGYLHGGGQGTLSSIGFEPVGVGETTGEGSGAVVASLLVAMTGAVLLMLPVSWGYMGARRLTGFDQSVVQTMVILPLAVAGIVVMVKSSVALAFSLAGIVAGVRFRNSLSDTADALYIFAAIGVGLAAGIGELGVAAGISVFFNYVILGLWSCDYGTCPISGPQAGWSSGTVKGQPTAAKSKKKKGKHRKKNGREKSTTLPPDVTQPQSEGKVS